MEPFWYFCALSSSSCYLLRLLGFSRQTADANDTSKPGWIRMSLHWQACVIHPCWVCVYISVCMCCAWQQKQAWQWWMSTRKAESQHHTQRCRAGNDPRRYCHNPQRQREPTRMRTGVKKATHITKHVALNGSAIVAAFKRDLSYAFPFRLALRKGAPLLFSLRMWHMYSPSFTGNNVVVWIIHLWLFMVSLKAEVIPPLTNGSWKEWLNSSQCGSLWGQKPCLSRFDNAELSTLGQVLAHIPSYTRKNWVSWIIRRFPGCVFLTPSSFSVLVTLAHLPWAVPFTWPIELSRR